MAEIIKTYRQSVGATRFIGKKYGDSDRINGMFGAKWGEWNENGWFDAIKKQVGGNTGEIYENGDAAIGLMRDENGELKYWIGLFTPENTAVPEGFKYVDFPKGELGVCWVYGNEDEIWGFEGECGERLEEEGKKEGFEVDIEWCFEGYTSRLDTPDDKGNVILDICFYIK
jgi:predicted transcriptional regulator YdeE